VLHAACTSPGIQIHRNVGIGVILHIGSSMHIDACTAILFFWASVTVLKEHKAHPKHMLNAKMPSALC
jgi:hypothetical protein